MTTNLNIFDIERFAIHDGPGIRSVIFFQGCPLFCPWCANPESQKIKKHLFYDVKKCVSCGACEQVCPSKAISFHEGKFTYDENSCERCNKCVEECLQSALKFVGQTISLDDVMKEIAKDDDYYEHSQGGITISGGEAFVQFNGLMELLKALKAKDYHVCMETCGQTSTEKIEATLPYVDLFLFDLKHSDPTIFKLITGGDLNQVKKNIETIASHDSNKIVLRTPVIPDFNHSLEVIEQIVAFASERSIKKVQLLPYHNLGKNKYKMMGLDYQYETVPNMTESELEPYLFLQEKYQVSIVI